MVEKKVADIVVRPRRQVTIPRKVCEQLGIRPGDVLELTVEGSAIVARPKKAVALKALKEIQRAFQRSGVTEAELLEAGRRVRQQLARERYGASG